MWALKGHNIQYTIDEWIVIKPFITIVCIHGMTGVVGWRFNTMIDYGRTCIENTTNLLEHRSRLTNWKAFSKRCYVYSKIHKKVGEHVCFNSMRDSQCPEPLGGCQPDRGRRWDSGRLKSKWFWSLNTGHTTFRFNTWCYY